MNGPGSARRLLGVFAHPDDEVFCAGGTMARAAEAGAEVMIVSATRGEQGQIRDPAAATRRTLGAVREGELRAAAAELGVQRVQVLAYPDGTLQQHRSSLGAAIAGIMRQFDPDTVITFGADGGYGHPDHVAISELTTAAFRGLVRDHHRGQRLYHAVFPPRRTSMAEELAHWIAGSGQRATDRAALQAIALFAGESATMRLARDDVRVAVVSPGHARDRARRAGRGAVPDPQRDRRCSAGASRRPGDPRCGGCSRVTSSASMAWWRARARRTWWPARVSPASSCPARRSGPTPDAAPAPPAPPSAQPPRAPPGTCAVDVTSYLHRKLGALARHRTQYPIVPSMLPHSLLQQMLGTEFFCRTAGGSGNAAVSRRAQVSRRQWQGAARRRYTSGEHRDPGTHPPHTVAPACCATFPHVRTPGRPRSLVTEPAQAAGGARPAAWRPEAR